MFTGVKVTTAEVLRDLKNTRAVNRFCNCICVDNVDCN